MKTPTACRNDSRQGTVFTLCLTDVSHPFTVVTFGIEVEQCSLAGKRGICGPSIFFPLWTIGRKMIKIRNDTAFCDFLKFVCYRVRAVKISKRIQLCMINKIGQKAVRSLLLCDSVHLDVTESVVRKGRCIYLCISTFANVRVFVYDIFIAFPKVPNKPYLRNIEVSVLERICITQGNFLSFRSIYTQATDPCMRHSEIVYKPIVATENFNGLNLRFLNNRSNICQSDFAFGCSGGQSVSPI